jgi:predicted phage tail component-like protein
LTLSVTFGGKDLSELVDGFTAITRNVGTGWSNTYQDAIVGQPGQNFLYNSLQVKTISIEYKINGWSRRFAKVREQMAHLLSVTKPVELIFADEPNKVWYAVPDGNQTLTEDYNTGVATGVLTFAVPSGYAESKTFARVLDSNPAGAKGIVTADGNSHYKITLQNDGSLDAYPIIRIKHNSENGYIGVVNANGTLELGKRAEADTEAYKKSEILFDYRNSIEDGFNKAQKNVGIFNDTSQKLNSALGIDRAWGRPHIALSGNHAQTAGGNAGSITWEIPTDSNGEKGALNEYLWWRQIVWAGLASQVGFMKISFTGENGEFLYGVETFKRKTGLDCEYNFLASNGKGGYRIIDPASHNFQITDSIYHNPFDATRGWSDLLRRDDMVQVYWWGSYPQFHVPEIKGKKTTKIHVCIGALGNKGQITHLYLDQIYYRKDFVSAIRDIPNRFPMGSTVEIDFGKGQISTDGLVSNRDLVTGSEFFSIPKGKSELDLYFSDWVKKPPSIEILWKECLL